MRTCHDARATALKTYRPLFTRNTSLHPVYFHPVRDTILAADLCTLEGMLLGHALSAQGRLGMAAVRFVAVDPTALVTDDGSLRPRADTTVDGFGLALLQYAMRVFQATCNLQLLVPSLKGDCGRVPTDIVDSVNGRLLEHLPQDDEVIKRPSITFVTYAAGSNQSEALLEAGMKS
jgi:hypothetical protein